MDDSSALPVSLVNDSHTVADRLLPAIAAASSQGVGISVTELSTLAGTSTATVKRHLRRLLEEQKIMRIGQARATRYFAVTGSAAVISPGQAQTGIRVASGCAIISCSRWLCTDSG